MKMTNREPTFFKEIPALRILVYFILGIFTADFLNIEPTPLGLSSLIIVLIILVSLSFSNSHNNLYFSILTNISFFISGILLTLLAHTEYKKSHFIHIDQDQIIAMCKVEEEPKKGNKTRLILSVQKAQSTEGIWYNASGKLLAYLPIDESSSELNTGDIILIHSPLHKIKTNQNPLAFDYKSYLHYKGIQYQCFIDRIEWSFIRHDSQNSLRAIAQNLRLKCQKILTNYIHDTDNLAVASAMLLGLRNNLSEEIYSAYTDTGAVHVLAVSGLHVGYINAILLFIFSLFLGRNNFAEFIKFFLVIAGIWMFAFMTGAAPAVLRAATMFTMLTLGHVIFKRYNIFNILGASAFILLLSDPLLLFQGSFQFSYLALASILYWQPKIMSLFYVKHPTIKKLYNLLMVAVAAQILVFPVTIYYFHKFASSFLISGIVAIIFAAIVICGSIVLISLSAIDQVMIETTHMSIHYIVDFVAFLLNFVLSAFIQSIKWIQALPYSNLDKIWIESYEMILVYMIIISIMFWISFKYSKSLILILSILIIFCLGRIKQAIQVQRQTAVIAYDVQKAIAIDLIKANQCYSLASESEDSKLLKFARDNYRISIGIDRSTSLNLDRDSLSIIQSYDGIIRFDNQTFAVAHHTLTSWEYLDSIDILFVGDVDTYTFSEQLSDKYIGQIVINHYMNNYQIQRLKSRLIEDNHNVHYVGDQAFITQLD